MNISIHITSRSLGNSWRKNCHLLLEYFIKDFILLYCEVILPFTRNDWKTYSRHTGETEDLITPFPHPLLLTV
jgi:hypothetical protein